MSLVLATVLVLVVVPVPVFGTGCESSGGDRGLYQPDMTWGPGSNNLYDPMGVNWVEQFCEHVHVTCQEYPEDYPSCLSEWQYSQQQCPFEVSALLSCFDAVYECGDYEDWELWEVVMMACQSEVYQYEMCMDPYWQWD
jgi:hypothetical protein